MLSCHMTYEQKIIFQFFSNYYGSNFFLLSPNYFLQIQESWVEWWTEVFREVGETVI